MKKWFAKSLFLICFSCTAVSSAQDMPVGLFEGVMGNSGIATFESTAPSYYNPALLSFRKKKSIVLGGNTLSTFTSKTETTNTSGSSFNPTYISNIDVFESYAHEFFIVNIVDADIVSEYFSDQIKTRFYSKLQNLAAGYSFAFPGFPMGFQALLFQNSNSGTAQFDGPISSTAKTFGNVRVQTKASHFGLGISTLLNFESYNLGFNFRSRTAKLLQSNSSRVKAYIYDSNSNFFSETDNQLESNADRPVGNTLLIGQAFKVGAHEFLTDTSLVESEFLDQSYEWRQSYGYRLGLHENHQYLVGLSHLINDKVKYFGQDAFYSTGYSWKTRNYRSSIGLFVRNQKISSSNQIYGFTFNSEFTY